MHYNKHILRLIVLAIEFLAKQALSFRGHHEHAVNFSEEDMNRGNFNATVQIMAKEIVVYECNFSLLKEVQSTTKKSFKIRLFISMRVQSEKYLLNNSKRFAYLSPS